MYKDLHVDWKHTNNIEMGIKEKKLNEMTNCRQKQRNISEDIDSKKEKLEKTKHIRFDPESEAEEGIKKEKNKIDDILTEAIRANSLASSITSRKSFAKKLQEIDEEQKQKMKNTKYQRRKATVMVTSGALTIILLAATLVTATFLMSPVIEKVFGKYQTMTTRHMILPLLCTVLPLPSLERSLSGPAIRSLCYLRVCNWAEGASSAS